MKKLASKMQLMYSTW